MNKLEQHADKAKRLQLKFMLAIGMKRKVYNYLRYNGLGKDYLN